MFSDLKIVTGSSNPELAKAICDHLGCQLTPTLSTTFSDGELRIEIGDNVRGDDVFVVQPTCPPNVNRNLVQLCLMLDALKRASAGSITAVIPYYGYARQDRKTRGREPITAKLIANLLTTAGISRLVTMDLHAGQIQGFFDIPVDHLPGVPILAEYFAAKHLDDLVVVSPDLGGVTRARQLADRLHADIAILDKRRPMPGVAEIMNLIGCVEGRNAVIIDDIVDTAGSLGEGAKALERHGAKAVYACCTHPVLSAPACQRLKDSIIKELVVTNTIPLPAEKCFEKLKVLSVAPLLGEAIIRIYDDLSVSRLFDT